MRILAGTLALLIAAAAIAAFLWSEAEDARRAARARALVVERATFDRKAAEIERMVTQLYQGARTISLLPSIRALQGGNLPAGFAAPDGAKFDRARFSADAEATVQQIYNNLASNVRVSEVYAILDGFRPDRGETPFFMFDEVRVQGLGVAAHDEAEVDPDEPEESEEAEYAYYVDLLAQLRATRPRLDLAATPLDAIPAYTSPLLRTCDNAQYTSKARGDERDAGGFTISVPIYRPDTTLVGIISVIVRADVFEAALRDQPFLLITDDDRRAAARVGMTPRGPGRFVLRNEDRAFAISDREQDLAALRRAAGSAPIARTLTIPTGERWSLELHVPAAILDVGAAAIRRTFYERLGLAGLFVGLLTLGLGLAERQRRRLLGAVGGIVAHTDHVRGSAARVDDASRSLAEGAASQAASIQETSAAIEQIAATSRKNADHARDTRAHVEAARDHAERGATQMDELVGAMEAIRTSSDEIARIVQVSDEIAFQTHVLALNAAVEAARAGVAGASFSVVADEVRNLARRSAEAARETTALIDRAAGASARGAALTAAVQTSLHAIVASVRDSQALAAQISDASAEQARAVAQCNAAVAQIDRVIQITATTANDVAAAAGEATSQVAELAGEARRLVGHATPANDAGANAA